MNAVVDDVRTFNAATLPSGWRAVTLANIVGREGVFVDGDWVESKDQDPEGDVRLIQLADVGDGEYRDRSERFLTSQKARELSCTFLEPGDLLVARMPDPLGRACIFPGDSRRAVTVVDVAVVRPRHREVNLRWLMYCINAPQFRRVVASLQSGSTRQRISRKNLAKIVFPLPPLCVQDDVVAEIEKQFSRLDEAVANLKRAKTKLKRYKAAVLKAAVEGRLVPTEAELARRDGRGYETGTELLRRIFEVRRSQWNGRGKYKEPDPPDMRVLPQLSEGWAWATVEMVCTRIVDCPHSTPRFHTSGHPCIDTTWMTPDGLAAERARFVDGPTYRERVARLEPCSGDVVFAREGTIGTAVVVPPRMQPCLGQRVMLLRSAAFFSNALLVHILHSDLIKSQYRAQALGSTVPHINLGDVKRFAIPVPPSGEQERLVAEVDRQLSLVREVEGAVDQNLQRASSFRQAALANAFSTSVFA